MQRGEGKNKINSVIINIYDILENEEKNGNYSFSEEVYEYLVEYEKVLSYRIYIKKYLEEKGLLQKYSNILKISDINILSFVYSCLKKVKDEKEKNKAICALLNLNSNLFSYGDAFNITKYYTLKEDCVFKDILNEVELYDTTFMKEEFISLLIDEYTTKNICNSYNDMFKKICSDLFFIQEDYLSDKGKEQFIELLNKLLLYYQHLIQINEEKEVVVASINEDEKVHMLKLDTKIKKR